MNNYTCTKCGVVSTIGSDAEELKGVKCTCGTEPVTLKRGIHKIENAKQQNKVAAPTLPAQPPANKPAPPIVFNPSAHSRIKTPVSGGGAPVVLATSTPVVQTANVPQVALDSMQVAVDSGVVETPVTQAVVSLPNSKPAVPAQVATDDGVVKLTQSTASPIPEPAQAGANNPNVAGVDNSPKDGKVPTQLEKAAEKSNTPVPTTHTK